MKIKQTIRIIALAGLLAMPIVTSLSAPYVANAADTTNTTSCGGVQTAIIQCGGSKDATTPQGTGLWGLLLLVINILTAGVGVVALAGLVYGSILYTSAGGNPEQVKKARTIFTNVVIGIIAYAAMWALLNFIIPGGVL